MPAQTGSDRAPLPRFQLPQEPSTDPSDVAETIERAPVTMDRARKLIRRRTLAAVPPSADSTQDVAPEDILLEAYPDPPRTRRMLPDLVEDEVDELLRATEPPAVPSVAPVALAAMHTPPAFTPAAKRGMPAIRGVLVALALFVVGVAATATVVMLVPVDAFARARATARALVDRAPAAPPAPAAKPAAAASAIAAPPPVAAPAPPPAPVATAMAAPVVSVDALPKSTIAPDTTVVTLPPYAAGHRVYVDDVVVSDGASPVKMRCGKHRIRIGSQGKAREVDLPCGRDLVLR